MSPVRVCGGQAGVDWSLRALPLTHHQGQAHQPRGRAAATTDLQVYSISTREFQFSSTDF